MSSPIYGSLTAFLLSGRAHTTIHGIIMPSRRETRNYSLLIDQVCQPRSQKTSSERSERERRSRLPRNALTTLCSLLVVADQRSFFLWRFIFSSAGGVSRVLFAVGRRFFLLGTPRRAWTREQNNMQIKLGGNILVFFCFTEKGSTIPGTC